MADKRLNLIVDLVNKTEKGFKAIYGDIETTQKKMEATTRAMRTAGVVGAVAFGAIGVGLYKATQSAVDAQETFNKFDVVFGDVSDQAESVAQDLRNNFGMAESSAKDLLSSTGDMLTGFGLSGASALDLAEKTNKLAVDLASFTNIEGGAERASIALTKALLGERDSIKMLGIAILEEDVKAKVKALEVAGRFINETEREKKAIATLEIAFSQSKNAIGDYARTSEGAANKQRELLARMKELGENLGTVFVPILESVLNIMVPIILNISQWIKENPRLTAVIGLASLALTAMLAVLLPLSFILPNIILSVGYFSKALTGLKKIMLLNVSVTKSFTTVKNAMTAATLRQSAATKAFVVSLRTVRGAIMATGIGALIVAATFLIVKFVELKDVVGGFGKAFVVVWKQIKIAFFSAIQGVLIGLDALFEKIPGMANVIADSTIEAFDTMKNEAKDEIGEIAYEASKIGTSAEDSASAMASATDEINTSLAGTAVAAKDNADEVDEYFNTLVDSVKEIRGEIKDAYNEISEATADFQKSVGEEQASFEGGVVNKVAAALNKQKELESEIRKARKDDDSGAEVRKLENQLDEQKELIESYKDLELNIEDEVAERRRYLRLNEIEQMAQDHKTKLNLIKTEYLTEQVERLTKMKNLHEEHNQVLALTDSETLAKLQAEAKKGEAFRDRLAAEKSGLHNWQQESRQMYVDYVRDINSTLSNIRSGGSSRSSRFGIDGARAAGGPVSRGSTYLVGEQGPELFSPSSSGQITANDQIGGTRQVIINMNGGTYLDNNVAEKIGDQIIQNFKRNARI